MRQVVLGVLSCLFFTIPAAASGQTLLELDARGAELSRDELTLLLQDLEQASMAPGYSRDLRSRAAMEAAYVRSRLQEGDFQVGDRVVLAVRGEPSLTDTFTVTGARTIDLPQIGPIPLDGVLRSELTDHLTSEIGQYVREPDVRAQSLIRIAVLGAVRAPGFYTLPASALLEEALMSAGGPAPQADVENVRIQRGSEVVWEGDLLQRAMVEGRTLDQLSLQAGDRIDVPQDKPGIFEGGVVRGLLVTVPTLVYLLSRIL